MNDLDHGRSHTPAATLGRTECDCDTRKSEIFECNKGGIPVADVPFYIRDAFFGLEPMIPLQWQIMQKRAPGCYVAEDSKLKHAAQTQLPSTFKHKGASQSNKTDAKRSKREKRRDRKERKLAEFRAAETGQQEPLVAQDNQSTSCPSTTTKSGSPMHTETSSCGSPDQLFIEESAEMESE
ncbi:hypothetical protein NECAME_13797 [Necator americanus]|uniref:Uncharacterized protein n=1 Tax=Necator americanus TaxID=51031 RepID=W2SSP8_NECAM|nr:hypothetical protein NECAME_13797 [Necator americanus]ETN72660.1 hypothetical protein NECAME_13797 [Necator americanus]